MGNAEGDPGLAPSRFLVSCAVPVASIAGMGIGGAWTWLGISVYLALYLVWDALGPADTRPPVVRDHPLLTALLFLQLPLLILAWFAFLAVFAGADGPASAPRGLLGAVGLAHPRAATPLELLGAALSFAMTTTIAGNVTGHELIHRTGSPAALLAGRFQLAFIFDAAFSIEHVYGHHAKVATREDAATARRGEGLYVFILRSTIQSFRSAWDIERKRLARAGEPLWSWRNRNLRGIALSLALLLASGALAGMPAMGAFILCGAFAKAMLEAANYLEHYGLVRVPGTRVAPRHSWDTAAPISRIGMFALSRHAAHHVAVRPYAMLALETDSPKLPSGLVASLLLAAVPPLWHGIMAERLARWDREQATEAERALAAAASTI